MRKVDVCVIGGGAAGLVAAISAKRQGRSVLILEHTNRVGKKLLATGNGRCNFTNVNQDLSNYRGASSEFINTVLEQFGYEDTIRFFKELGIIPKDRNGYIYPNSNQASSVLDVLLFELKALKISVLYEVDVEEIVHQKNSFEIYTNKDDINSNAIILSTGSKANKVTGSDGSGYDLAKAFGHSIKPVVPALVQLRSDSKVFKKVAGVRTDAKVTLIVDDNTISNDIGELQLTDYGISGIPVFQISRFAALALFEKRDVYVDVDFLPQFNEEEIKALLALRFKMPKRTVVESLTGILNYKLLVMLLNEAGIDENKNVNDLNEKEIDKLLKLFTSFKVKITETNSFENAQVCAGGVNCDEINPLTMESKLVKGLFFAGEILDVDGACGGYNLQWAWSSGFVAGKNA